MTEKELKRLLGKLDSEIIQSFIKVQKIFEKQTLKGNVTNEDAVLVAVNIMESYLAAASSNMTRIYEVSMKNPDQKTKLVALKAAQELHDEIIKKHLKSCEKMKTEYFENIMRS